MYTKILGCNQEIKPKSSQDTSSWVKTSVTWNLFNETIEGNFPNIIKMDIIIQGYLEAPKAHDNMYGGE